MNMLPNPINDRDLIQGETPDGRACRKALLAPRHGYNPTALGSVRILRTKRCFTTFPCSISRARCSCCREASRASSKGKSSLYDEDHYLAVSLPVPFRMKSTPVPSGHCWPSMSSSTCRWRPRSPCRWKNTPNWRVTNRKAWCRAGWRRYRGCAAAPSDGARQRPAEVAVLGAAFCANCTTGCWSAARRRDDRCASAKGHIRKDDPEPGLAAGKLRLRNRGRRSGKGGRHERSFLPRHFKDLTGSSPMQYVKAMRLHEARLMIARQSSDDRRRRSIGRLRSPAQFSRDFKRHFGRTASEETKWVRHHLGSVD
jgi:hypothetical protein